MKTKDMRSSTATAVVHHGPVSDCGPASKGYAVAATAESDSSTDDEEVPETVGPVKQKRLDDPVAVTVDASAAESSMLRFKQQLSRSAQQAQMQLWSVNLPTPSSAKPDDSPSRPPPEPAPDAQDTQVLPRALEIECDRSPSPEIQQFPSFIDMMASDRMKQPRTYSKKARSPTMLNSTSSQDALSEEGPSAQKTIITAGDDCARSGNRIDHQGLEDLEPNAGLPDTIDTSSALGDAALAAVVAERTVTWGKRKRDVNDTSTRSYKCVKAVEVVPLSDNGATESSTRTRASSKVGTTSHSPKVLLTGGGDVSRARIMASLKSLHITVINRIPASKSDFICVVGDSDSALKTTAKVLRTLSRNRPVVTSRWVLDSKSHGKALRPEDYIHDKVVDTMETNRSTLFHGKVLFFTDALVKHYKAKWRHVKALVKETGATRVVTGVPTYLSKLRANWICFGRNTDDPTALALLERDHDVFHKDMLTQSILGGEINLDSDVFKIRPSAVSRPKSKKAKSRYP